MAAKIHGRLGTPLTFNVSGSGDNTGNIVSYTVPVGRKATVALRSSFNVTSNGGGSSGTFVFTIMAAGGIIGTFRLFIEAGALPDGLYISDAGIPLAAGEQVMAVLSQAGGSGAATATLILFGIEEDI